MTDNRVKSLGNTPINDHRTFGCSLQITCDNGEEVIIENTQGFRNETPNYIIFQREKSDWLFCYMWNGKYEEEKDSGFMFVNIDNGDIFKTPVFSAFRLSDINFSPSGFYFSYYTGIYGSSEGNISVVDIRDLNNTKRILTFDCDYDENYPIPIFTSHCWEKRNDKDVFLFIKQVPFKLLAKNDYKILQESKSSLQQIDTEFYKISIDDSSSTPMILHDSGVYGFNLDDNLLIFGPEAFLDPDTMYNDFIIGNDTDSYIFNEDGNYHIENNMDNLMKKYDNQDITVQLEFRNLKYVKDNSTKSGHNYVKVNEWQLNHFDEEKGWDNKGEWIAFQSN